MNYDPNFTNSGHMADQIVELTFQQWEYTAMLTTTVGGNCTGLSVIECAVENVLDKLGGEAGAIVLKKPNGDTLSCDLWEHRLANMLVGARIIAITPRKEKSASLQ